MKALVAGWFSFEQMGATAGDLYARDVLCGWLDRAGCSYDVALAPPFVGGVEWTRVEPDKYSHLIFVCGPFGRSWMVTQFLQRFAGRHLVGVNLSMLEPLEIWNPFDLLLARDSSAAARPDLSFLAHAPRVPVVGVVLIDSQPEYAGNDAKQTANAAISRVVASREVCAVRIDTRLDINSGGLRTPSEVGSLIAKMDVVLTTRMHGLVLALKNGVPVVAVDPVAGGAKVKRQAETVGWPCVFTADSATDRQLLQGLEFCLTEDARTQAKQCALRAARVLERTAEDFLSYMRSTGRTESAREVSR